MEVDGDPYGNRDTGIVDILETVEVPEDSPIWKGDEINIPAAVHLHQFTATHGQLEKYDITQDFTCLFQPKWFYNFEAV